jgi:CRISPR-associated protein Cmr3
MNTLLLYPTDILFFRDGRPMSGSLSGHGAAWPLPTVINHAFHAAMHRAGEFEGSHKHVPGRSSSSRDYSEDNRRTNGRLFGSLTTAGPFPVDPDGQWFFPRPMDAGLAGSTAVTLKPLKAVFGRSLSSLPDPLQYPSANTQTASKAKLDAWLNADAFQSYLNGRHPKTREVFAHDDSFSDAEHSIGIGINADRGTQDGERFYSASYLRLREGWRFGVMAQAEDKEYRHPVHGSDLVRALFAGDGTEIIAGGQQRTCRVTVEPKGVPLPAGPSITGTLVKWVLLTPAIFPAISADPERNINAHPGGWLPNWIQHITGEVLLKCGNTARRERESREAWRARVRNEQPIAAHLVAAITGKPIPVTGYALPNSAAPDLQGGGAKSTHLAVPAGAVYYFTCHDEAAAQALAAALNWHGAGDATTIRNRRSTLMGEKGFGLGVCGTWEFHNGKRPTAD